MKRSLLSYTSNLLTGMVLLLLLGSCEKGLEPQVFNAIAPENFPKTESDVSTIVAGSYHELRGGGWERYTSSWGGWLTQGIGNTDEFITNWYTIEQEDYLWRPESGFCSTFYNQMLPAVTKITRNIEQIKLAPVSAPVIDQAVVELRCVRAMLAFDLYDQYGPVPIIKDPEYAMDIQKASTYQPTRPSKDGYVSFLETELREVAKSLPVSYDAANFGRMSKGAALTVLLKLYMHEKRWDDAVAVTRQIMDLKHYQLQPAFSDIWAPGNKGNLEIIFALPNVAIEGGYGNNWLAHVLPPSYVSKNNVPLTRWNGFRLPWAVWDSFDPKDKRREPFVRWYWNGTKMVDGRTDPNLAKGAIPMKYPENPNTTGTDDASDYVIYRYADVLLCRAEALNEVNKAPTQESIDLVNLLRARGEVPPLKLADFDLNSFRDRILQERQWELCYEGSRRQDLIRHGKLISNALSRGKTQASEKHLLFPIPQKAINENPNLVQNPGY